MGADCKVKQPEKSIVLFDDQCNLCTASVQFIIRRDKQNRFRFASLQSAAGEALLRLYNVPSTPTDTVVLIHNGKAYTESEAALYIARYLSGWWPVLYACIVVPAFIRNAFYRFIARNRYRWFGKRRECWLPDETLRSRFLEE